MTDSHKKNLITASIGVLIILIVLIIIKNKRKKEQINQIIQDIKTGKGENIHDIDSLLSNVTADSSFAAAGSEAKRLQKARGWLWDSDKTIFDVLLNKTKAQLKQISIELVHIEGLSLGQFINNVFSGFSDGGKIERAFHIVNNSK